LVTRPPREPEAETQCLGRSPHGPLRRLPSESRMSVCKTAGQVNRSREWKGFRRDLSGLVTASQTHVIYQQEVPYRAREKSETGIHFSVRIVPESLTSLVRAMK